MSKVLLLICGSINGRPTGGVTMHVHRLLKRLVEPKVKHYMLCDYKKDTFHEQLLKIREADVMHIHASNPFLKLFFVFTGKLLNSKSLITLHGNYGYYGPWKNWINKMALKFCDVPILINQESYESVKTFNNNAILIPAFIPPIEEEEFLSPSIEDAVNRIKSKGKKLFVTNASRRAFSDDGTEVYGIDFLVSFFSDRPDFHLVVLDPENEYAPFYNDSLPDNVSIFSGAHSFCGLIRLADVVIRNTSTDGDSFSVKEALWLNKPVLATDIVSRPEGVVLFRYNDTSSLAEAITRVFFSDNDSKQDVKGALDMYETLYKQYGLI